MTHTTWCMKTPTVGVAIGPCDCGVETTYDLKDYPSRAAQWYAAFPRKR